MKYINLLLVFLLVSCGGGGGGGGAAAPPVAFALTLASGIFSTNEDTDLNIRFLKAGYCTINFQMFLGDKATTMTIKGGNTDSVYTDGDNRLLFAQSLQKQHPDVVTISQKWGRCHHHLVLYYY